MEWQGWQRGWLVMTGGLLSILSGKSVGINKQCLPWLCSGLLVPPIYHRWSKVWSPARLGNLTTYAFPNGKPAIYCRIVFKWKIVKAGYSGLIGHWSTNLRETTSALIPQKNSSLGAKCRGAYGFCSKYVGNLLITIQLGCGLPEGSNLLLFCPEHLEHCLAHSRAQEIFVDWMNAL